MTHSLSSSFSKQVGKHLRIALACVCAAAPLGALAHHSFAIFDFQTQIPFEGTVETLKFRNPHIEMTLKQVDADGKETIIHFIEGAPANMLARQGLKPSDLKKGTKVTGIGSPLLDDNTKFFLRSIILEDGREFRN
jgi:hypothetical protein